MISVFDRYQNDAEFRALVDVLTSQIYAARFTPTEIREAAVMAQIIVERHAIRPMIIPLRELDQIGRRFPPGGDLAAHDREIREQIGRVTQGPRRNHDDGGDGVPNP